MANYLWQFTSNNSTNTGSPTTTPNAVTPLPVLSPAGSKPNNIANTGSTNGNQLVNVVRDFYWTYSKPGDVSRSEVPKIILTERRLKTNALIAQLKYSLTNIGNPSSSTIAEAEQNFGPIATVLGKAVNAIVPTAGLAAVQPQLQSARQFAQQTGQASLQAAANSTVGQIAQQAGQGISQSAAILAAKAANAFSDDNPTVSSNPLLQPYQNLYLTEPTNWVYILPYFTDNQSLQGNSFSDTGSPLKGTIGGLAQAGVNFATGLAEFASTLASPTQITFVEKTKFFDYDTNGGETIDVEFPLINTGSVAYDDVVRNWQLLFLLVYQNRPGKTGFNTVDQPVIYQVEVPGTKFFPYCYIQSINIDFVGSRREMPITVPSSSSETNSTASSISTNITTQTINTVIPDAYKVRITLKSLTANTRNFMAYMLSPHNIIETGTSLPALTPPSPVQAPGISTGAKTSTTPFTQSISVVEPTA